MVGCVIERDGIVIGIGHHAKFGGLHAEREAIKDCRKRGYDPAGATMYCTLEPCCHHGKQPPCTEAVLEAGLSRVIFARHDPAEQSAGGGEILRQRGVDARCVASSTLATRISDPFVQRVRTGRPWVIAKWAQTLDGRIATRTGESQWITGELMRRRVHRLRSRVDAIMVGRGTVMADDPMLTPRGVRRVRRMPIRVVLDSDAQIPNACKLVQSAVDVPTVVMTGEYSNHIVKPVKQLVTTRSDAGLDLDDAIRVLASAMGVSVLLVEAGPRVLGSLIEHDLIDEAFVHLAPMVLGDSSALPASMGRVAPRLADARRFELLRMKELLGDIELHYRRSIVP